MECVVVVDSYVECVAVVDSDAESCESWEGEALGMEECLFCSHISDSLEKNVEHMTLKHSFFIPDAEYLSDLEGLVIYLGQSCVLALFIIQYL